MGKIDENSFWSPAASGGWSIACFLYDCWVITCSLERDLLHVIFLLMKLLRNFAINHV